MKQQRSREEEEEDPSSVISLSGLDYREKKRPRRTSSWDSLIENDGSVINSKNYNDVSSAGVVGGARSAFATPELTPEVTTPRLLALISSLAAATEGAGGSRNFESLTPSFYSAAKEPRAEEEAGSAVTAPQVVRPMMVKPQVHTIVERSLGNDCGGGDNDASATTGGGATTATATSHQQQQQEMMRLATLMADVTSKIPRPTTASATAPSSSSSLANSGGAALYSSFAFSQQQQERRQAQVTAAAAAAATSMSMSTRQQAIHSAVHSDYKKIFRPLHCPPRLPTANEAMSVVPAASLRAARGRTAIAVTGQSYR